MEQAYEPSITLRMAPSGLQVTAEATGLMDGRQWRNVNIFPIDMPLGKAIELLLRDYYYGIARNRLDDSLSAWGKR
jgi:hypothetical protein